jgi:hypothetical protein
MPERIESKYTREKIGDLFDQIGTLAIAGEMNAEDKLVTKEELRAVVQKIVDKTHLIQQLLQ